MENGKSRTQKVIADAAGVTEVTIRNLYTKLKKVLDLDGRKPGTRTRRRVDAETQGYVAEG